MLQCNGDLAEGGVNGDRGGVGVNGDGGWVGEVRRGEAENDIMLPVSTACHRCGLPVVVSG